MSNAKTKKPPISDAFVHQINILKALSVQRSTSSEVRAVQIEEISELSGVCDDKEIQRYLFILEGQKLVSPQPEGDFTSKMWIITRDGLRVVKRAQLAAAA
jgi:hypothetical protein